MRFALVAVALVLAPATARAQTRFTWTPSLAGAVHTRLRGDAEVDGAFDLLVEGFVGASGARGGAFVGGRVTGHGELSASAGAALAIHLSRSDPGTSLVLSLGGALGSRDGLDPAALARAWWGLRGLIDGSSPYEIAVGLWAEARYHPTDGAVDLVAGVSVDPWALAAPFRFIAGALSR